MTQSNSTKWLSEAPLPSCSSSVSNLARLLGKSQPTQLPHVFSRELFRSSVEAEGYHVECVDGVPVIKVDGKDYSVSHFVTEVFKMYQNAMSTKNSFDFFFLILSLESYLSSCGVKDATEKPAAVISIPPTLTLIEREALVSAAEEAGINVREKERMCV